MTQYSGGEFRDIAVAARYPFADDATLTTRDGLTLHESTFVDAVVYPPGARTTVGIRSVEITERHATLWIGDETQPRLASGTFDRLDTADAVPLVDLYDRPAGLLLTDPVHLSVFQTWPLGRHDLTAKAAPFVASCVIPLPAVGVQGFVVGGVVLTGDVWFVGEDGVVLSEEDGAIRVDIVGDPLFVRRLCGPVDLFQTRRFVKTINGIPPDEYGNFNFVVGSGVKESTILRLGMTPPDKFLMQTVGKTLKGR